MSNEPVAIRPDVEVEPTKTKIVAICPTVERGDLVRQLVKSYREVAGPIPPPLVFHVMGDDEGTEGWLTNQGLPVVRTPEILPYAKANNQVVQHLAGLGLDPEWLLLLNNDLILQPGFFEALDQMIAINYDIIGAKLLYPDGKIQHYGKIYTLDWVPFHILRYQPADHPQAQMIRPFPDVTFACVAIRKVVWDDLGGLCEEYTNGYEDDDFCLQARERGAQIGVHPGMLATHLESQTSGKDAGNKAAQYQIFKQKWVDSGRIQWPLGMYQGWANNA